MTPKRERPPVRDRAFPAPVLCGQPNEDVPVWDFHRYSGLRVKTLNEEVSDSPSDDDRVEDLADRSLDPD